MPVCVFPSHSPLFQIEIFKLKIELTFWSDRKHLKPSLINDIDNLSEHAICFHFAFIVNGFVTRSFLKRTENKKTKSKANTRRGN